MFYFLIQDGLIRKLSCKVRNQEHSNLNGFFFWMNVFFFTSYIVFQNCFVRKRNYFRFFLSYFMDVSLSRIRIIRKEIYIFLKWVEVIQVFCFPPSILMNLFQMLKSLKHVLNQAQIIQLNWNMLHQMYDSFILPILHQLFIAMVIYNDLFYNQNRSNWFGVYCLRIVFYYQKADILRGIPGIQQDVRVPTLLTEVCASAYVILL